MKKKIVKNQFAERVDKVLTVKQKRFCSLYARNKDCFANGTRSYLKAYNMKDSQYDTARCQASKLLRISYVLDRINELLDVDFNDASVDKQLAFVISQNENLPAKISAMKEYNALKGRIKQRIEHSGHLSIADIVQGLEKQDNNKK